jgi:hypothetical protein
MHVMVSWTRETEGWLRRTSRLAWLRGVMDSCCSCRVGAKSVSLAIRRWVENGIVRFCSDFHKFHSTRIPVELKRSQHGLDTLAKISLFM